MLRFGADESRVGNNGTRSDRTAYDAAAYGSFHPTPPTFTDALVGYGVLNFDLHRYVTDAGALAVGTRHGDQVFESVMGGNEFVRGGFLLSPYARVTASHPDPDGFTETGVDINNLH